MELRPQLVSSALLSICLPLGICGRGHQGRLSLESLWSFVLTAGKLRCFVESAGLPTQLPVAQHFGIYIHRGCLAGPGVDAAPSAGATCGARKCSRIPISQGVSELMYFSILEQSFPIA